jgi:hypothetical protein
MIPFYNYSSGTDATTRQGTFIRVYVYESPVQNREYIRWGQIVTPYFYLNGSVLSEINSGIDTQVTVMNLTNFADRVDFNLSFTLYSNSTGSPTVDVSRLPQRVELLYNSTE